MFVLDMLVKKLHWTQTNLVSIFVNGRIVTERSKAKTVLIIKIFAFSFINL